MSEEIASHQMVPIPFIDLTRRVDRHRATVNSAIKRVLDSGQFILGGETKRFETIFAEYVGVKHGVCVANGTDAIELALRALKIDATKKVATVANAGNYATSAINAIGASPIYMDVDFASRNVNLQEVKSAVSNGAEAVVVTHLYGLAVAEIESIAGFCKLHSVPLIEDCAQAHGAKINGKVVGSFGNCATFSFYPTKNLGALGDAGAVVTDHPEIADSVAQLRTYGWTDKYSVALTGGRNSRADEVQCAVLTDLLPFLEQDNRRRREIARMYTAQLNVDDINLPSFNSEEYVGHLYVVSSKRRGHYIQELQNAGISTQIHFPIPDHKQPYITDQIWTELSVTERLCAEVFSLPCYPELTDQEVQRVIDVLRHSSELKLGRVLRI